MVCHFPCLGAARAGLWRSAGAGRPLVAHPALQVRLTRSRLKDPIGQELDLLRWLPPTVALGALGARAHVVQALLDEQRERSDGLLKPGVELDLVLAVKLHAHGCVLVHPHSSLLK